MPTLILMWLWLAFLDLLVMISCCVLAPILPLFADENGYLPHSLSAWYQTQDNSLDGDGGWQKDHFVGYPKYLKRVLWLWRNPGYGFSQVILAGHVKATDQVDIRGSSRVSNLNGVSGWSFKRLYRNGEVVYWQLYIVQQYFNSKYCFRLDFGWKIWDFKGKDGTIQFTSSIGLANQFKT